MRQCLMMLLRVYRAFHRVSRQTPNLHPQTLLYAQTLAKPVPNLRFLRNLVTHRLNLETNPGAFNKGVKYGVWFG